jgi:hypothetical protein
MLKSRRPKPRKLCPSKGREQIDFKWRLNFEMDPAVRKFAKSWTWTIAPVIPQSND